MKQLVWIADFFLEDVHGGAEIVNNIVMDELTELGWDIQKIHSKDATPEYILDNKDSKFVIANFLHISPDTYETIVKNVEYYVYEHDHKYVKTRDPSYFEANDYVAPTEMLANTPLYRNAKAVICQSGLHARVVRDNLLLDNVVNMKCSLWGREEISILRKNCNVEKTENALILESVHKSKGTPQAVAYAQQNNIDCNLIGKVSYEKLIESLAVHDKLIFFPQTLESFCRLIVEARALNCKLITNKNNGATYEEWFPSLQGEELIQYLEAHRSLAIAQLDTLFSTGACDWFIEPKSFPKVSLVTSMFKGEKHIRSFLEDITAQTAFKDCELIIINANSPENEDPVIEEYMEKYDNIVYKKLDKDPGIYGVWNLGIEMATGEYISNANLDDRRSPLHVELHALELAKNPDIDLVYAESFVTPNDHENFITNSSEGRVYPIADFSNENMIKCLPGCMPVWRKSMHDSAGLFEADYRYAGDWEMWLRAVRSGSTFRRLPGVHGMYYMNPDGLSTSPENEKVRFGEEKQIFWEYTDVFGKEVTEHFSEYFSGTRGE